jgi:hypothetical protein
MLLFDTIHRCFGNHLDHFASSLMCPKYHIVSIFGTPSVPQFVVLAF